MNNRNFSEWLLGFRDSIADYGYYIDFDKVHRNVDNIKVELNILNSLIGSNNIETDFENLINKYPETLKCIPLLLAVRSNEIYAIDGDDYKTTLAEYREKYDLGQREGRIVSMEDDQVEQKLKKGLRNQAFDVSI